MSRKNAASLRAMGLAILAIAGLAWPSVTSQPVSKSAQGGHEITIELTLNGASNPAVAGVTGQLNYDPKLFSNPRVLPGDGAQGFNAVGQLIEPGKFRFAACDNPMQDFDQGQPIAKFAFHVNPIKSRGISTQMTYSLATAGASDNASLSDVSFAAIHIDIYPSAARQWQNYE